MHLVHCSPHFKFAFQAPATTQKSQNPEGLSSNMMDLFSRLKRILMVLFLVKADWWLPHRLSPWTPVFCPCNLGGQLPAPVPCMLTSQLRPAWQQPEVFIYTFIFSTICFNKRLMLNRKALDKYIYLHFASLPDHNIPHHVLCSKMQIQNVVWCSSLARATLWLEIMLIIANACVQLSETVGAANCK